MTQDEMAPDKIVDSPASGEERQRLWRLMADRWPEYDRYQRRTRREIPVVVLIRAGADH
jgi:F420H(2)-dependent quinone reductase